MSFERSLRSAKPRGRRKIFGFQCPPLLNITSKFKRPPIYRQTTTVPYVEEAVSASPSSGARASAVLDRRSRDASAQQRVQRPREPRGERRVAREALEAVAALDQRAHARDR